MSILGLGNRLFAQSPERYKTIVFSTIDTLKDVQYGASTNLNNETEKLFLDIYIPKGDTEKLRPLLLCVHGGGFVNGDKGKGFQVSYCKSFAQKGYVTSSINYRLGVAKPRTDMTYFEAMYRAVQDAKAAVRFFRKNAVMYGIDPNKIYIIGGSAGSMTVLQLAYLDQNEVPSNVDTNRLGLLEGNSGNEGYSSKVQGVINCWGAMVDLNWIKKGDVPLYNIHGTADTTVSYDGSFSYHGFKYGSKNIYEHAKAQGIPTELKLFENAGHNIGNENQKIGIELVTNWLFTLVQNQKIVGLDFPQTLMLDGNTLAKNKANILAKMDVVKANALRSYLANADKIIQAGNLYSVMHKKQIPPSGDKHDYMSTGPYWWPDPSKPNGLPYIRRDGERNPEYYNITDTQEMDKLEDDVESLALAYYFTNDEKYATFASKLIKIWFLDPETRQNPNLNFGQAIPGVNDGRGIGIIETRALYRVIDAAILLTSSKSWTNDNQTNLKKWFADYLNWLTVSPNGIDEADEHNNHGTHYDVQYIIYALFSDKSDLAKKEIEVTKQRIASQLKPDGSQPFELARTKSWGYVNMNLYGFCEIARLAEHLNIDLWNYEAKDGKSIKNCVEWLVPYLKKEKPWSYQQIEKMHYEETIKLLKIAAKKYSNAGYDELAKETDQKIYDADVYQLIY